MLRTRLAIQAQEQSFLHYFHYHRYSGRLLCLLDQRLQQSLLLCAHLHLIQYHNIQTTGQWFFHFGKFVNGSGRRSISHRRK